MNYLTQPSKGYVDLNYAQTPRFHLYGKIKETAYKAIRTLLKSQATDEEALKYMLALPVLPKNLAQLLKDIRREVEAHRQLEHENKYMWKEQLFSKLPLYRMLTYGKKLVGKGNWRDFTMQVTSVMAEPYRNWEIFDFIIDSANEPCICN